MSKPITATIITLNEERHIEAVVASAFRLCDEVLVIDSESTDRTVELAEKAGARAIVQPYLGDGPQKHFGVQFAKNDWILSLDADERLGDGLVAAVEALDLEAAAEASFAFRRRTYVGDAWIKVWYPDYTTRLYHKGRAAYEDAIGHASVVGGVTRKIDADLLHYSFTDYGHLVSRAPKFALRGAKQVMERGRKVTCLSPLAHGLGAFLKDYILRGGILHGTDALNIAVNGAYVAYMKYAIALEKQRQAR